MKTAEGSAAELRIPSSFFIAKFVKSYEMALHRQAMRQIRTRLCRGMRACLANLDVDS